ncbi:MAG: PD-(D/E)XK nuclease domain-containing protein [Cyanobacteria bacterium P01_C01_bin.69]
MKFKTEADLQAAISAWLQSKGQATQREVETGGGRVDILTRSYLIEVKPKLTRSAQFQALGQLQTYDQRFPRHQKVIAGLLPSDRKSALATANRIRKDGVEVWFMDAMPEFLVFMGQGRRPARLGIAYTWWNRPYLYSKQIQGTIFSQSITWAFVVFIAWLWMLGTLSFSAAFGILAVIGVCWLAYEAVLNRFYGLR